MFNTTYDLYQWAGLERKWGLLHPAEAWRTGIKHNVYQNLLKRIITPLFFWRVPIVLLLYFHYFMRQFSFSNWRLIISWSEVLRQMRMLSYWFSEQNAMSVVKRLWTFSNIRLFPGFGGVLRLFWEKQESETVLALTFSSIVY